MAWKILLLPSWLYQDVLTCTHKHAQTSQLQLRRSDRRRTKQGSSFGTKALILEERWSERRVLAGVLPQWLTRACKVLEGAIFS